ncbi:MAG: hypothetical protein JW821_17545, partial [Deltaproteobacteria bacterium]|nr:hypothetical protein [Deltaproteobacteria bacterium]
VEDMPICFAHYGRGASSRFLLGRAREQLLLWEEIIRGELARSPADPIATCIESLLARDPCVEAFRYMSPGEQERERIFITNCIEGYMGYLEGEGK